MGKTVFVVDKNPITMKYPHSPQVEYSIREREVMKETPKGLRLVVDHTDNGSMYLHSEYDFFDTRVQALFRLEAATKAAMDELEERKNTLTQFLHDIEDAVFQEPSK